jgi:nitroreductase
MEVFNAVRTVLAVRDYQDKPIPPDLLRRILEAGRLTGSSMNGQPWHFIVVDDRDTLRRLAGTSPSMSYVARAPVAIVVAIEKSPYSISDASRAIQSMVLTAWAEGVGSNWVGFLRSLDQVNSILGIPKEIDVLAVLPLGYPKKTLGRGKKQRKPLSQIAHLGRFGQPFE